MTGEPRRSENGPVLDLERGSWLDRLGWMADRLADRLIPGSSGMEEPALVPIAAPRRPKHGAEQRK